MNNDYLMHHGVLGMKWGVRRYQNKDGTLTPRGRKHLHKIYNKESKLAYERLVSDKAVSDRYVRAHNSAADRMNSGLIDKYNAKYKNIDYDEDEYMSGYEELFNKVFNEEYRKMTISDMENDPGIQRIKELVSVYGKESLSDSAREALDTLNDLKKK